MHTLTEVKCYSAIYIYVITFIDSVHLQSTLNDGLKYKLKQK